MKTGLVRVLLVLLVCLFLLFLHSYFVTLTRYYVLTLNESTPGVLGSDAAPQSRLPGVPVYLVLFVSLGAQERSWER